MSTKTEHLALHQWAPTDNFSRAEINENFAKVDAFVGVPRCVTGTIKGTGQAELNVPLGFHPQFVIVSTIQDGSSPRVMFLAIGEEFVLYALGNTFAMDSGPTRPYGRLTEDGFKILGAGINMTSTTLCYVAFR